MKRIHPEGFTLIELLVVIAVIAILAAILFPVFAKARERGRATTCLSNMRQIANAMRMYADDNGGKYPTDLKDVKGGNPTTFQGEGRTQWFQLTAPYIHNQEVQRCPDDPSHASDLVDEDGKSAAFAPSYAMNTWFEFEFNESRTKRPSETVMMGEKRWHTGETTEADFDWWKWQSPDGKATVWPPKPGPAPTVVANTDLALDRHYGVSNWSFADGHVAALHFDQLWGNGTTTNQFWPTR